MDYETRQSPTFEIPWLLISEPTGFTGWFQHNFDSKILRVGIWGFWILQRSGYAHFQNIHFLNQKLEYSKTSYSNCKYYFWYYVREKKLYSSWKLYRLLSSNCLWPWLHPKASHSVPGLKMSPPQLLLKLKTKTGKISLISGHSISVLAERSLFLIDPGHCLQTASGLEPGYH